MMRVPYVAEGSDAERCIEANLRTAESLLFHAATIDDSRDAALSVVSAVIAGYDDPYFIDDAIYRCKKAAPYDERNLLDAPLGHLERARQATEWPGGRAPTAET